jgi:ethanolamine utilization protein EutN/carbon dioxide concentrating mechanism protein CcmL
MQIGLVVGTVVATHKDSGLTDYKLLIVQIVDIEMKPTLSYVVCVDAIGAGEGELVMTVSGSSARLTAHTREKPVDCAVVAIIDSVEVRGRLVFDKSEAAEVSAPTAATSTAALASGAASVPAGNRKGRTQGLR